VAISLQPNTLPADESSTSEATITVKDQNGNTVTGDAVAIDTEGGPSATAPALRNDGTYASVLTASRVPGEYAITATDTTAGISESAPLTQTVLPATGIQLTLEPASVVADPLSKAVAVATVTDELGQPVSGEEVEFESPYTAGVQPPADNGDGTYTWNVPVTAVPGAYEIVAVDRSVAPSISASATLLQTEKTPAKSPEKGPENTQGGDTAEPPTVTIQGGPKGTVHRARVRFAFAAAGAASFQCRLDGGRWKSCSSPATFTVAPGRHLFRVRGLSASGAAGPVAKRSFKRVPQHKRHRRHQAGGRWLRSSAAPRSG
jgi:hypothetical protein